jgi:8-oxo-dGTP pyrophosphatase MutT (NUDIX family)
MPETDLIAPSPFYRVSLKAIVLNAVQKILVVQLADGTWELPGGGWEHGESMQHCLRRELMEELNVGIDHIDFSQMYPYASLGRHKSWSLKLAVPVTLSDQELVPGDGAVAYAYVTATDLAQLDMVDAEAGIKTHIPRIWPDPTH